MATLGIKLQKKLGKHLTKLLRGKHNFREEKLRRLNLHQDRSFYITEFQRSLWPWILFFQSVLSWAVSTVSPSGSLTPSSVISILLAGLPTDSGISYAILHSKMLTSFFLTASVSLLKLSISWLRISIFHLFPVGL